MATTKTNRIRRPAAKTIRRYSTAAMAVHDDPELLCVRVTGLVTRDAAVAITSDVGGMLRSCPNKGVVWLFDAAAMALDPKSMAQVVAEVIRQVGVHMVSGCVMHADMRDWFAQFASLSAERNGFMFFPFTDQKKAVIWAIEHAEIYAGVNNGKRYTAAESARYFSALMRRAHFAAERIAKVGL